MVPNEVGEYGPMPDRLLAEYAAVNEIKKAHLTPGRYLHEMLVWRSMIPEQRVGVMAEVGGGRGLFLATMIVCGFVEKGIYVEPGVAADGTDSEDVRAAKALFDGLDIDVECRQYD